MLVAQSSPTLQFHAPYPARLLCPWNSPGKNTGLGSVQFSRSVVSDFLQPHELQHARPPCPSQIPEFTQTHAHRVSDAIQPSYPLSSPSPPAPNPSQHRGLFQWVNSSHEVAKVLEFQLFQLFLKWQVRWSGIPISFRIFHSLLWSTQSKALA